MIGMQLLAGAVEAMIVCADRPGRATGTCTVPARHFQVETGIADWSSQKADGERDTSITVGETTIKYGLDDRSNVEIDVVPFQRSTSRVDGSSEHDSGVGDINLLYKFRLTAADAPVNVALLPLVKFPIAKRPLGNGKVEGGLLVPASFSIPHSKLSVGVTPEIDCVADADGHGYHTAMVQVASVGWQVTTRFALSAEMWRQWNWDPAGTVRQASADTSAAFLATDRVQLDAGANVGLNRQTPDLELYAGISMLF